MDNTYHSQNNASHLNQPTKADAAPIDPNETASRGKPPGQAEAGVQKPGPGGTLEGEKPAKDPYAEELDEPDGSLDAFD
jgi:hypothetical protein